MSDSDVVEEVAAEREVGLPQFLVACWDCFGEPERAKALPITGWFPDDIPHDELGSSLTVEGFQVLHDAAITAFTNLVQVERQVAALVADSKVQSADGQEAINAVITVLNEEAPKQPGSKTEFEHIHDYMTAGLGAGEAHLKRVVAANKKIADGIGDNKNQLADGRNKLTQPPGPGTTIRKSPLRRLDPDTGRDRSGSERSERGDPKLREVERGIEEVKKALADAEARNGRLAQNGGAPQNAATDPVAQMAQMLGRLNGGLGGLNGGFGGGLNGGLNGRFDPRLERQRSALEREQSRLDRRQAELERNRTVAPPPRSQAPTASPPPSPPPPRLDPSKPLNAQPAKDDSEAKGAPTGRVTDEDGKCLYTFADGRQQRVWPVVADGLDVALANNAGTDAQAAYGGTSAKWDDDKEIGDRVDPSQLMTGDVCVFENTEAIAVVWGSPDSGGTLELVVNGELVPYDPEAKAFEAFGPFVGFMHPPIDLGAADGGVAVASANTENQAVPVAAG